MRNGSPPGESFLHGRINNNFSFKSETLINLSRFDGHAFAPSQLRHGDKPKALGFQLIHDLQRRLHRGVGHIVEQDHISVLNRLHHAAANLPGGMASSRSHLLTA